MTLLDTISATAASAATTTTTSLHPLTFNPDLILDDLTADPPNPANRFHLVEPVNGFHISNSNSAIADSNSKFSDNLTRRLNSVDTPLSSSKLANMLQLFLQEIGFHAKIPESTTALEPTSKHHWSYVTRPVLRLVVEACVSLGAWSILENLIANDLVVGQGLRSELVGKLIATSRSDLVCLCVKRFSGELDWSDLVRIMKYFLSPSKEARVSMVSVRKVWEDQALMAVNRYTVFAGSLKEVAKEAAVLLMVAYDEFTGPELCLHFLLSSIKVDDIVFPGAVSKLSVVEVLGLIRYLGKWLRKYERFPQAVSCPEAVTALDLDACQWVPTVEVVAEALGAVVDEWFSSLVLHSEFHEEMKSIAGVLSSLVVDGRLCGSVACLIESLPEPSKAS